MKPLETLKEQILIAKFLRQLKTWETEGQHLKIESDLLCRFGKEFGNKHEEIQEPVLDRLDQITKRLGELQMLTDILEVEAKPYMND